ncbi:GDP-mannose-dependent alpha-(1-6)-phosphatidylinositol dimannoside mannosyltransferase [Acholeplasma oculi]|uniref:Glycosyltransferase LafA n=1 Tax=Acholeplasma oculi TaxID=35623 RepID=A0A061A9Z0_9MOLU|nr:glycosyltransferase family 4 protein [Acholeplasma oculi]CDR30705.1 Glycosyltransferase LafA [Acholeplasma oculi]SKC34691.1 1,2-diacylglycerol 3-alpha-glucosyltransferase [Acholeplasma oculi]SUT89531.1 GDP-mannose-dependent alpha-(1-6)-phosphatidylinositol dimannoside mannosyltransferase [Acholeplasma oculi]
MRIGIFTEAYKPLISGVVTSVVTLKEGLEALGHEVYVITPRAPKQKEELDPYVIRLRGIVIPRKSLKGFRLVPWVKRHLNRIKHLQLDLVHIHTEFSMGLLGLAVGKKYRIPIVYTLHTSYQDYTHYVSKLMTYMIPNTSKKLAFFINNHYTKHCDMTIVPTKKIYDKMIRLKHDGRFTILPSGIDLKPFYKESYHAEKVQQLKDQLNIKDGEFIAMIVARVAKEKSINDLIVAFSEFHKDYPNSKFFIIGDGPEKPALEHLIEKKKAGEYIKMLGFIPHEVVGLYYQVADVFLNASTTETQGLTYVEALAASLPIIVRYDEVFDSFVEDGKNGIFFRKTEELVDKLKEIQEKPEILKTLQLNAKESVKKYSKESYAKSAQKLYLELIEENKTKLSLKKTR